MPRSCATENCERMTRADFRWCDDCTAVVLRTGRPPVLPVKFVPRWLANVRAKELRDAA
jgi:hypothetical protein